jgi:hypothetical protein
MDVVSIVANLQKERDWYKEQFKECQAIIKQLVDGPGEFEYIHPFDVAEMFNIAGGTDFIDVFTKSSYAADTNGCFIWGSSGKKYKQSPNIPAKSKNFK